MGDFVQVHCFLQCICICVPSCLHWQSFFLPFISVVLAQLSEAGEHVSFIEATPLSTPEVFPESSLSDLPFGSRCPLVRHTFLYMVPLPIQLLRARCASSTSFARELCTGVFDHNPFETFARPIFSSFLPSESTIDVARCPSLNGGQYATARDLIIKFLWRFASGRRQLPFARSQLHSVVSTLRGAENSDVQEKVCGQLPSWKSILPGTNQWGVGSTSR